MIPRHRIFLASAGFAAALAVTVLGLTLAYTAWLNAQPFTDPPDNAPIRAAGLILVAGVPLTFIVALVLAISVTYRLQRATGISKSAVAKLVGVSALTVGVVLAFPASAFASIWSLSYLAAALMVTVLAGLTLTPASICWWFLMRRPLTNGWSGRER